MAQVPDRRVDGLCEVYHPKKVTLASLELVDTPGLARDHAGNAARLGLIRQSGCLVLVVAAFDRTDPARDLQLFEEDLLLADLEIVTGRIERLRQSVKKPRPNRQQEQAELEALEALAPRLEAGEPLSEAQLHDQQLKAVRSFGLLALKPRIVVLNVADDEEDPERWLDGVRAQLPGELPALAIPVGLQVELARLPETERAELVEEMNLVVSDRDSVLRSIMDVSRQMLFFTAGEKEVRTWIISKQSTALECAASIHTDMARGFIRAEVMDSADLIRLGSERAIKAEGLVRQEPKDYIVQDGDVLLMKFNV